MSEDVLTRPTPPPHDTRPYAAGPAHVYDVRFPALPRSKRPNGGPTGTSDTSFGTVLVVHGGFWRAAYDRSHAGAQAAALADAGWHVAVAEYRRASMPGGGVPGTLDDITALVEAVVEDLDLPEPLVLMGHSAGGHLVAWAANQPWAATWVAGVVMLAGCVDLRETDRLQLGDGAARTFVGDPHDHPERWQLADPMSSLPPRCPVRLVHGDRDAEVPVEVSRSYFERAASTGADVTLEVVAGADHYDLIDPESPAWPHVLAAAAGLR